MTKIQYNFKSNFSKARSSNCNRKYTRPRSWNSRY